ncbi:hypothetical protein PAA8504_03321 [Palleronia abyssalis]|uniref:Uncharacterized protein n=1 Tax=Palleronia abyssalis TaxID=1501240 RepID=A0A2R8BZB2_9RHOB|nr:hypothetical protein PAA8504_03321 [Palleronia abyssalis]
MAFLAVRADWAANQSRTVGMGTGRMTSATDPVAATRGCGHSVFCRRSCLGLARNLSRSRARSRRLPLFARCDPRRGRRRGPPAWPRRRDAAAGSSHPRHCCHEGHFGVVARVFPRSLMSRGLARRELPEALHGGRIWQAMYGFREKDGTGGTGSISPRVCRHGRLFPVAGASAGTGRDHGAPQGPARPGRAVTGLPAGRSGGARCQVPGARRRGGRRSRD